MKRLFVNIDDIYIKGSPTALADIISHMDASMQTIAEATQQLLDNLARFCASNKGERIRKTIEFTTQLRDVLYDASVELNEMQNQIVLSQNKILRYEGMRQMAAHPQPHLVSKKQIHARVGATEFHLAEMTALVTEMTRYQEAVVRHTRTLQAGKSQAAAYWADSQYRNFSEFIDGVCMTIVQALKRFEEEKAMLESKIKELS